MKQIFSFSDGGHNILEITESIFVVWGRQNYLWSETTKFTKAYVSDSRWIRNEWSLYFHKRCRNTILRKHIYILYKVKICVTVGHREMWWPPAAKRDFCSSKDDVANGQGEFEGHSAQKSASDFKKSYDVICERSINKITYWAILNRIIDSMSLVS